MSKKAKPTLATPKVKFDEKFGPAFIRSLPTSPAVYKVYDSGETLIYIGKAKNLRRRLGQYRNAKRRKKHYKMRAVVAEASRIEYECCDTDLAACLLEAELIQASRPRLNVEGAFYFLYPMIGLRQKDSNLEFCFTSSPEKFPEFSFHGAYRSRHFTGEAYFALMKLLRFAGHPTPRKRSELPKYSYVSSFRNLPADWEKHWAGFFSGQSKLAIEELILALVENAGARRSGKKIQEYINALTRFWRHEAAALANARKAAGFTEYPVPQSKRDVLFVQYRFHKKESRSRRAKMPSLRLNESHNS